MGNCFGGNPNYGYPGYGYDQYGAGYGPGYGAGYGPGYGPGYGYGIDADPITPGIQPMPGLVTQIGPPVVAGIAPPLNGSFVGGIPPIPSYAPQMTTYIPPPMAPMPISPMVSMAPIAPVGPQSILNPAMLGTSYAQQSMYGRPGYPIDIDPITPGIQTTPGLVTANGPSYILGL